jgi:hypothetical protein
MKKIVGFVLLVIVLFQIRALAQPPANDEPVVGELQATAQIEASTTGQAQGSPSDLKTRGGVSEVRAVGKTKVSCKTRCRVRRVFRLRFRCRR